MALLTAAEARALLPGLTGTGEDSAIEETIEEATELAASWCGYPPASATGAATLESTAYTRELTGRGGRDLVLDVWPATAISSVRDDPSRDWTDDTYLISSSDYTLIEGRLVRLKSTASHGGWSKTPGGIRVVYTAGYTAGSVPPQLKRALAELVKHLRSRVKVQGSASVSSKSGGQTLREEAGAIPEEIQAKLARYRLPRSML